MFVIHSVLFMLLNIEFVLSNVSFMKLYPNVNISNSLLNDMKYLENEKIGTLKYLEHINTSLSIQSDCGTWQQDYTNLHNSILNHTSPRRYLIFVAPPQGLADRITGLVSSFIYALITRRAFVHTAPNNTAGMEIAYELQNINSLMPKEFIENQEYLLDIPKKGYPSYVNKTKKFGIYLNAGNTTVDTYRAMVGRNNYLFMRANLRKVPYKHTNTEELYITMNRGYANRIFHNKHHKKEMYDYGLSPETTFKCVFDYLFKLKDNSCDSNCQSLKNTIINKKKSGAVVIGIQIRIGDVAFESNFDIFTDHPNDQTHLTNENESFRLKNNTLKLPNHVAMPLACAVSIGQRIERADKEVLYYLISDSLQLKQYAKALFGNQLLTDTTYQPTHIYEKQHATQIEKQHLAIRQSASDMHLYSLAHVHVITKTSGFGQKAAYLSESKNRIHVFYGHRGYNCSLDRTYSVAENWSGV